MVLGPAVMGLCHKAGGQRLLQSFLNRFQPMTRNMTSTCQPNTSVTPSSRDGLWYDHDSEQGSTDSDKSFKLSSSRGFGSEKKRAGFRLTNLHVKKSKPEYSPTLGQRNG
eukprot:4610057-Amphidinium_carterae.3